MANQSEKKNKKKNISTNRIYLIMIGISTGIYIIMNLYQKYKYNKIFTKKQIFGFCFLSIMNYFLFQLLNLFRGSYWESYLIDILGLNCLIEILINFHWKFWYLYLIYPGYFLIKGGKKLFDYVGTIGKYDENEEINQQTNQFKNQGHKNKNLKKDNTDKPKIKYVKH